MKIVGDSIQKGIPMPDDPKEIKTTTKIIIEGRNGERQEIELPKEKIDGMFIKENDKWYLRHLERTKIKIHKIYTMEGEYEDVEYEGDIEEFICKIENSCVVRIIENSKLIYINSDYIISFEI